MNKSQQKYFKKIKRVELKFSLKDLEAYKFITTRAHAEDMTVQAYIKQLIYKELDNE